MGTRRADARPSTPAPAPTDVPVVVIGGGQAGLATGHHLRRAGLEPLEDFVVLDASPQPGGAWSYAWDSLELLSSAAQSVLPGAPTVPGQRAGDDHPTAEEVRSHLAAYEEAHALHVVRPVRVDAVTRSDLDGRLLVHTDEAVLRAEAVVSATGTWERPFWPVRPGAERFEGTQVHSADYRGPGKFAGQRVLVVGGGNSAAQILAEVATVAETAWVTRRPPRFGPDGIALVPAVRRARELGVMEPEPLFSRFGRDRVVWDDGTGALVDAVIWCTGFRPALDHLRPLRVRDARGLVAVEGTRSVLEPRLHLVGYGDWTGSASGTLAGVGASARAAVDEVVAALHSRTSCA